MSIIAEMTAVLGSDDEAKSENFEKQLKAYKEFLAKMEAAGVAPKKQDFSIPLIERIGTLNFSK